MRMRKEPQPELFVRRGTVARAGVNANQALQCLEVVTRHVNVDVNLTRCLFWSGAAP